MPGINTAAIRHEVRPGSLWVFISFGTVRNSIDNQAIQEFNRQFDQWLFICSQAGFFFGSNLGSNRPAISVHTQTSSVEANRLLIPPIVIPSIKSEVK